MLEWPQESSSPSFCSKECQLWDQTRFLRALSSRRIS